MNDSPRRSGLSKLALAPLRLLDEIRLVAAWDMTRQARRPSFFMIRILLAAFVGGQVILSWRNRLARSWYGDAPAPDFVNINQFVYAIQDIFESSVFIMAISVVLLCPALTAGAIAGDRERKIWHDLANSPLSGWSILMGKMVARLATVFAWILAAMPIWAILSLIGGLDPLAITLVMLGLFLYGWMYAAMGLLASVATKRSRDALGLVTTAVVLLLVVPIMTEPVFELFGIRYLFPLIQEYVSYLTLFNPVICLPGFNRNNFIFGGANRPFASLVPLFAILTLAGPALTLLAGLLLRPLGRRLDNTGATPVRTRQSFRLSRRLIPSFVTRFSSRLADFGPLRFWNGPMAVKERKIRSGSRLTRLIRSGAVALYLIITTILMIQYLGSALKEIENYGYYSQNDNAREQVLILIVAVNGFSSVMLYYGLMLDAAGRMVMEKEQDTWTTLLSTPLEPLEIFTGKAVGAFWSWRWLFAQLIAFWTIGVLLGALSPLALIFLLIVWPVQLTFVTLLGLRIGQNSATHASVVFKCIGMFLLFQFLMPFLMAQIAEEYAFALQPTFMSSLTAFVGQTNVDSTLSKTNLPGLVWQCVLAAASVAILYEITHAFDRRTGKSHAGDRGHDDDDETIL